jgi:hypothetical protein
MKFDASTGSFLLACIGAFSGWIAWWNSKLKFERQQATQEAVRAAEKALNEERDFNHLKKNQEQISDGIAHGFDGIEEVLEDLMRQLLEIKAYLIRYGVITDNDHK